jgi:hypothetical protein
MTTLEEAREARKAKKRKQAAPVPSVPGKPKPARAQKKTRLSPHFGLTKPVLKGYPDPRTAKPGEIIAWLRENRNGFGDFHRHLSDMVLQTWEAWRLKSHFERCSQLVGGSFGRAINNASVVRSLKLEEAKNLPNFAGKRNLVKKNKTNRDSLMVDFTQVMDTDHLRMMYAVFLRMVQ